jgi:hypothetical protein
VCGDRHARNIRRLTWKVLNVLARPRPNGDRACLDVASALRGAVPTHGRPTTHYAMEPRG